MWIKGLALAAAVQTAAAPSVALAPKGKWIVAYEEEMCLLTRDYSTDGQALRYAVKPVTFGEVADLMIVIGGKNLGQEYRHGRAAVRLGPGNPPIEGRFRSWRAPNNVARIVAIEVPRSALSQIAAAKELELSADRKNFRIRQTGGVKALAALDICEANMIKAFSAGAETENDLEVDGPPVPGQSAGFAGNPARWITSNDYPMEAVRQRLDGTTGARWIVGTDGRVKKCLITARSDHPALDALVCKALVERGRYRPAIGADGKPVESVASRRVVWKLP